MEDTIKELIMALENVTSDHPCMDCRYANHLEFGVPPLCDGDKCSGLEDWEEAIKLLKRIKGEE